MWELVVDECFTWDDNPTPTQRLAYIILVHHGSSIETTGYISMRRGLGTGVTVLFKQKYLMMHISVVTTSDARIKAAVKVMS